MFPNRQSKIMLMLVCAILGFMVVLQFRITKHKNNDSVVIQRSQEAIIRLQEVTKERNNLLVELDKLHKIIDNKVVEQENIDLKAQAGTIAMHGPGVIITVDDSVKASKQGENPNLYLIHDDDLLRIINELKAAGAEAISINKERMIASSEIRCAGPTVVVNGHRFTPPYYIRAIGNPEVLRTALVMRGGVLDTLKFWGIQVDIVEEKNVNVTAYKGVTKMEYAKVGEVK